MKRHKKWLALGLLTGALQLMAAPLPDVPPPEVSHAAQTGLNTFLQQAWMDDPVLYGFDLADAGLEFKLGDPWRLYVLPPSAVLASPQDQPVMNLLTPSTLWYFPVKAGGQAGALLAVDNVNGEWKAVSLGYAGLAYALSQVQAQWPATNGYYPRLVVSFQARSHLFTIPEAGPNNLTLLQDRPGPTPSPSYEKLDSWPLIQSQLKPLVQTSIAVFPTKEPLEPKP